MEKNRSTLIEVVLVGRPNVGKSSLFNALLGKRRAIVDPTRGVTRDVVQEIYKGAEVTFSLSDTGGFTLDLDEMSSTVREKTISQLNKSGIVIFVIDVMEWTPEDEEFTRLLRPLADNVILVVNKVDSDKKMASFYDYASLGFSESIATSVSHYKGISKLKEILEDRVKYIESLEGTFSSQGLDDIDNHNEKSIRIAILGRPNSGKSTLINALSEEEVSLVSPVAGTTRDAIKTRFKHGKTWYEIWDTAGIRRRSKVDESVEYYSVNRAFKSLNDVDVVLLMVESLEDLSSQDKKIASQVVSRGRPVILCLSKWDLLKKEKNLLEAITDRIRFLFPLLDFAPIVPISSLKREGFEDLFKKIHQIYKQSLLKIETSRLNNALKSWTADFPPPRPYKVKYLTQVDCHPIKYIIFVNNDEAFPTSYLSYLKNRIRSLGHSHVPIHIEVRKSS